MKNRISVKFLRPLDVVRFDHKSAGSIIGVVSRTFTSGGKYGASVTGVTNQSQPVDLHIKEGQILELLWREEEKAKSATQE